MYANAHKTIEQTKYYKMWNNWNTVYTVEQFTHKVREREREYQEETFTWMQNSFPFSVGAVCFNFGKFYLYFSCCVFVRSFSFNFPFVLLFLHLLVGPIQCSSFNILFILGLSFRYSGLYDMKSCLCCAYIENEWISGASTTSEVLLHHAYFSPSFHHCSLRVYLAKAYYTPYMLKL